MHGEVSVAALHQCVLRASLLSLKRKRQAMAAAGSARQMAGTCAAETARLDCPSWHLVLDHVKQTVE